MGRMPFLMVVCHRDGRFVEAVGIWPGFEHAAGEENLVCKKRFLNLFACFEGFAGLSGWPPPRRPRVPLP